jgi:hypothetical protein
VKNILLSVVVMAVLIAGGIGGTLADFSDIEISQENFFKTAALDLAVSDYLGNEYNGATVPAFLELSNGWPCCSKDFRFDLHNLGQGEQDLPWVYLHFKNMECGWVVPKVVYAWLNEAGATVPAPTPPPGGWVEGVQGTGFPKPVNEPEYVAEIGGIAGEDVNGNPVIVPGIGVCYGDSCQLSRHIDIAMFTSRVSINGPWTAVDLSRYDTDPANGIIKLNEIECHEIELGQLAGCNTIYVMVSVHLQDIPEAYFGMNYFDETIPAEAKWDHWPTNALQKDALHFDIAFELLQTRFVP